MDPLLPAVRRCTQPVALRQVAARRPELEPIARRLGHWHDLLLVEDRPDRVRFVQVGDVADADAAWDRALGNLGDRAHEPVRRTGTVVEVVDWGGFASSLVALPAWRRVVADAIGGEPLFLAPDVDHLRVVDANDPSLADHLDWAFTTFRTTDRPLSPAPLLQPALAPRNLRLLMAFAYAEQDEVLLETAPDGTYVAETRLELTGSDAVLSTRVEPGYACWLPEVDVVDLPSGRVPFASLGLPEVPDVHPRRFLS